MKTVRRPPYPKWNPGYFPCSSLTPLPLSSRRPSVSFGGFGLKGRRQIIVATHNANIVVNGDADQVIQLEATATHGHIACSGAIEEPAVRDAIVQTVDGGNEAFRLRRLKYGF